MTRFKTNKRITGIARLFSLAAALTVLLAPAAARAGIIGETGSIISLTASEGYISIADGGSIYSWGYKGNSTSGPMQLPGPTLIVTEGETVVVTLSNNLPAAAGNTSIVFPGHQVTVTAGTGVPGQLTQEAAPGGSVEYTFIASEPGTYQYHSGTRPDLQVEMGLYGALIVRPLTAAAGCTVASAYNHAETCYDREYLYLLSEVDIEVHQAAESQASGPGPIDVGPGPFHPEYWLLNGRAAPDTMAAAGTELLSNQPYNAMTRMHPGEKLLLRVVGGGRDLHPFHTHGNHARVLARDGRLLLSETDPDQLAGPLLFTIPSAPGSTVDAVFEWTGKDLGWDIYGGNSGIFVANAGFEEPALLVGESATLPTGVMPAGQPGGWRKSNTSTGRIFHPSNGLNVVEGVNNYQSFGTDLVVQTLGDVLAEGTYTLRVAVGDQGSAAQTFGDYRVQLGVDSNGSLAGGFQLLAGETNTQAPNNEFKDSIVSFTAPAGHPNLGDRLVIRLRAFNAVQDEWVLFDDVRLAYATHDCVPDVGGYDLVTREWCADHGRPIPVELPNLSSMAFGGFYSGSPYLGAMASLPPGEGGLNPDAGFAYMWHSHTEREMVNNDVFPGGMMTMLIIEATNVLIIE